MLTCTTLVTMSLLEPPAATQITDCWDPLLPYHHSLVDKPLNKRVAVPIRARVTDINTCDRVVRWLLHGCDMVVVWLWHGCDMVVTWL